MTWAAPLVVARRFAGPPRSANGGYLAGLLAGRLAAGGPVRVTLRRPPPLEAPLAVTADGAALTLRDGDTVVARAEPADDAGPGVPPILPEQAVAAEQGYAGLAGHPFPGCVVCGPAREWPDGLGLRPGPVPGRAGDVATTWTVAADLAGRPEVVWAALDCPGGWALDLTGRPAVLGTFTARVAALPEPGARCVVVGRALDPVGRSGRTARSATAAYGADGRELGRALAVWVEVDPVAFSRLGRA